MGVITLKQRSSVFITLSIEREITLQRIRTNVWHVIHNRFFF